MPPKTSADLHTAGGKWLILSCTEIFPSPYSWGYTVLFSSMSLSILNNIWGRRYGGTGMVVIPMEKCWSWSQHNRRPKGSAASG